MATNGTDITHVTIDDDEDEDDQEVKLTADECQKLVEEFVALTQTDEALAQFYLQDRQWDVNRSVNDYLDQLATASGSGSTGDQNNSRKRHAIADEVVVSSDDNDVDNDNSNDCDIVFDTKNTKTLKTSDKSTEEEENQEVVTDIKDLRFICWNIDGIDEKNLRLRTEAVCKFIRNEKAFIVFLQEVNQTAESILRQQLPDYELLTGDSQIVDYYTATLIHKKSIKLDTNEIIPFHDSMMGRNLLKTKISIGNKSVYLLNTHLESTKDFADIRVQQLRRVFKLMTELDQQSTVIFGGDLNLRDNEVAKCGIPHKVYDVWIKTGARKELEYTWDMTRNDNLQFMGAKYKPRLRFDRIYVRPSTVAAAAPEVEAIRFGLIGLERLKPHVCFPSDHWGLTVHFKIK
ncbi:tyrosyl-DNA phosphodiesterase 2-like [Oppia nitens]|uniref:tyrosyl-DNA phosphodiesterase 2-like n=1 Tax=Oppia nitens TaxID=1686743 RepID=UPI0023DA18A3|nr:tyrosyl-DNA phosphodiesterase 2-like [Oppia nitens]